MGLIFDQEYPSTVTEAMMNNVTLSLEARVPVYGAFKSNTAMFSLDTTTGQMYQVFRNHMSVSRREVEGAYYGSKSKVEQLKKLLMEFIEELKTARQCAEYAVGMPDSVILWDGQKQIELSPRHFRTFYYDSFKS